MLLSLWSALGDAVLFESAPAAAATVRLGLGRAGRAGVDVEHQAAARGDRRAVADHHLDVVRKVA